MTPDQKAAIQRRAEQVDADFVTLASMPEGRRFLWRLMTSSRVFDASWSASAQIHYTEGQRSVGLSILRDLTRLCPDRYLDMVRTYVDDLKLAQALSAQATEQHREGFPDE